MLWQHLAPLINAGVILSMAGPRLYPLNGRIKLRHLVAFLEVARLKSVVKTAALLGLSQPAVSKTVQELEDILGATLFEPNRRPMVLTGPGEIFFRYAGASLTALKQGVSMVGDEGADADVAFSVGALPTVSAHVLPRALAEVTRRYGAMRPRVVTGPNDVLMSQLRLGDLDLVIGRMPDPETMRGFAFEHLYSERLALVVGPDHPLLAASPLEMTRVVQHQWLLPPPGSVISSTVERYLVTHALRPAAGVIETVSDAFARNYLRLTDAIWFISEGVVAEDVATGWLSVLAADTADTVGPVGLTTRIDAALPLPAQLLTAILRERAARRAEEASRPGAS
ncbi:MULTISPECIES: pca operon transcription factor PcaQ [unclassified Bosea (in: a-proteobacteria)]|uniref:pca operon transcription factor PcaQ n=1 Tax=unclassified Bosea (in: a-proteobacteria) TaxID=2653178 RepID=UPI000A803133|nr:MULTISPECIES: pca operon transcription factor PcaQ [unclassified Bosea (in: a-proteobacteria)]